MAGSTLQVRVSSLALSVALHLALAVALAGINHTPLVPVSTSVTVTLIDSVGESPVPLPPRSKPVVKIARVAPKKTQPPVSARSEQAASPSTPEASVTADETSASSASITLPRFNAAYLNNPAPIYPPVARRMGEQGRVVLYVRVRADGTPVEVTIDRSSGSPRLDQAAIKAVRQWRFIPARRGEAFVEAPVLVPISFTLHS